MILWRVLRDAGQVAQLVVSLHRPATAVDAGQAALEIAARYVQEPAKEPAIQPARRYAIVGVQMNALVVKGPVQMIARQDAKRIAFRPAQRIVQTLAQTAQVDVETVALRHALMTAQVDAKVVATQPAQRIA